MMKRVLIIGALLLGACTACTEKKEPATLKIAAAADLAFAFRDLGAVFETKTGIKPVFTFGSTGLLAKQIKEGAPYDVFAAANVSFADDVVKSGACDASSKSLYARGRVVVWTRNNQEAAQKLEDLAVPKFVKIAI